jgi:hypothetical protein
LTGFLKDLEKISSPKALFSNGKRFMLNRFVKKKIDKEKESLFLFLFYWR